MLCPPCIRAQQHPTSLQTSLNFVQRHCLVRIITVVLRQSARRDVSASLSLRRGTRSRCRCRHHCLVPPAEAGEHLVVRRGVGLSHRRQERGGVVLPLGVAAASSVALDGSPGGRRAAAGAAVSTTSSSRSKSGRMRSDSRRRQIYPSNQAKTKRRGAKQSTALGRNKLRSG